MNTFTIILLVYVIIDIIVDTYAIIQFKRKGYSLRYIAGRMRRFLSNKPMVYDAPTTTPTPTPTHSRTNIEIFKESESVEKAELDIINSFCNIIRIYEDTANGIVAFHLDCKSRYVANTIVDALNEEFDDWYLGDEDEEYVYVD